MSVGVRELKLRATRLVRHAAGGQHVMITRYGKPCAMLGPPGDDHDAEQPPAGRRMSEWLREQRAFQRLLPRLERRRGDRWVAVHRGRVVGSSGDHDALFERIWKRLHGRTFFMGRVGGPAPIVDMPGFDLA